MDAPLPSPDLGLRRINANTRVSPEKRTIMFGAHRASIDGTTATVKMMALTTAAKDQIRESQASELTGRPARPKILDEEFQDYYKLLDNA